MGVGSQCNVPTALPLGKMQYPLYSRLGGPWGQSGWEQKILSPLGFDPWIVQPVVICCTNCAIPAHYGNFNIHFCYNYDPEEYRLPVSKAV